MKSIPEYTNEFSHKIMRAIAPSRIPGNANESVAMINALCIVYASMAFRFEGIAEPADADVRGLATEISHLADRYIDDCRSK